MSGGRRIGLVLGSSGFSDLSPGAYDGLATRLDATASELEAYLCEGVGIDREDLLVLFNDARWPTEQLQAINDWIITRTRGQRPVDIFLFFVGHGVQTAGGASKLALRKSRQDGADDTVLDPDLLSSYLVGAAPEGSRYFIYLDCCYARNIGEAMRFRPRTFAQGADEFGVSPLPPLVGGALFLAASDHDLKAFAPPDSQFTRMTTAFLAALQEPASSRLSFDQVHSRMLRYIARKEDEGVWRRENTPKPVLVPHKTDRQPLSHEPVLQPGWRAPVDDFVVRHDPEQLLIIVVGRERRSDGLFSAVDEAVISFGDEIEKAAGKRLPDDGDSGRVVQLNVRDAFNSPDSLKRRLRAICQADVVFFDTSDDPGTGIEPGVMFFLGVRAVARRGVSICSVDIPAEKLYGVRLPYNLQFLNIGSHASTVGTSRSARVLAKVECGFAALRNSPDYLDLPAYDAVRELGVSAESYAPIPISESPLYLGPFHEAVIESCFEPLQRALCARLLTFVEKRRTGRNYVENYKIKRLLDDSATKLVGLTLYESIRRHEFCLIDWTQMRPNVMFEFGVRLATSPKGAVHIMADMGGGTSVRPARANSFGVSWPVGADASDPTELYHARAMRALFAPIIYYPTDEHNLRNKSAREMIAKFQSSNNFLSDDDQYYNEIADSIPGASSDPLSDAIDVIGQSARYFYVRGDDQLRVTTLHADRNQALKMDAMARAAALHLAEVFLRAVNGDDGRLGLELGEFENLLDRELGRRQENAETVEKLRRGLTILKQGGIG